MTAAARSSSDRHPDNVWFDAAACRGLPAEVFYPEVGANVGRARAVCRTCSVQVECLIDAFETPVGDDFFGVRGGLSPLERRQLRKYLPERPLVIEHGTARGYTQHRRAGTEPCQACRYAKAEYQRELGDRAREAKAERERAEAEAVAFEEAEAS
jgi:hypothetical protein